jgi:anti-anti-sigma factor
MEEPFRAPSVARASPLIASDVRLDVESHDLASGVTLVLLRGAVDADTAPYLEECLAGPIGRHASGSVQILLNLAGVTFLDRAGLEALLRVQEAVADAGGAMELLALSPSIVRLLHEAELNGESWMQPDSDGF